MGYQQFDCDLYIERRELTSDWVTALCHQLWRHGIRLVSPDIAATWDEQLNGHFPHTPYSQPTLAEQIDQMVEDGFGNLDLWDRKLDISMHIDPAFKEEVSNHSYDDPDIQLLETAPLGLVNLYLHSPQAADIALPPDVIHPRAGYGVTPTAYLIRPKYQVYLAMAYWTEVLCASLHPVFGVGYHYLDAADDNEFWANHHQHIVRALAQGEMPSLEPLLTRKAILYAGPRFATTELLRFWAAHEDKSVKLLPDGGILAYQYPAPYDIAVAGEYLERAGDRRLAESGRLTYLRRAREIFDLYRGHREVYGRMADSIGRDEIGNMEIQGLRQQHE